MMAVVNIIYYRLLAGHIRWEDDYAKIRYSIGFEKRAYSGRTYALIKTKIEGYMEDAESLKQAIGKVLLTEQFEYPIYSFRYGIAWKQVMGEDYPFARAEIKRMIQETLMRDDRILGVDDFAFEFSGDGCVCEVKGNSIYGEFMVEKEVMV